MKKYTRKEIMQLVKQELIKTFGGLSHDKKGKPIETPYIVLGILGCSIPEEDERS